MPTRQEIQEARKAAEKQINDEFITAHEQRKTRDLARIKVMDDINQGRKKWHEFTRDELRGVHIQEEKVVRDPLPGGKEDPRLPPRSE